MKKVIFKYPIKHGNTSIQLPTGAVIRHVGLQGDVPTLWVETNSEVLREKSTVYRRFTTVLTGETIHNREGQQAQFLGTAGTPGMGFVIHFYEWVDDL